MPHSIVVRESPTDLTVDLTTVEAVNELLGVTNPTTEQNAETADDIEQKSKIIAEVCDRTFARQTVVETFMLHECWLHGLPLTHWPVSAVASVTVNGAALASTDYKVEPESGLLWRWGAAACRGWTHGEIAIEYTAGYNLPDDAPASLARACAELIQSDLLQARTVASGIRDIQHGDSRVQFFDLSQTVSKDYARSEEHTSELQSLRHL